MSFIPLLPGPGRKPDLTEISICINSFFDFTMMKMLFISQISAPVITAFVFIADLNQLLD
jgi:hypothetical protein